MLTLTLPGWVVMTGGGQSMRTTPTALSVVPQELLARTQKLVVFVSDGVISNDGKLKYSSLPRIAAMACSSVPPSSPATSPLVPPRRRNRAKYVCTNLV